MYLRVFASDFFFKPGNRRRQFSHGKPLIKLNLDGQHQIAVICFFDSESFIASNNTSFEKGLTRNHDTPKPRASLRYPSPSAVIAMIGSAERRGVLLT